MDGSIGWRKIPAVRGAAAFGGRGVALRAAPRPAKQKSRALGLWPRALLFQDASRPAAPPAGFSANAKKAAQTPAPLRPTREKVVATASLFPRGMARETLSERGTAPVHSVGKARAHALRARAEQPAPPRATASGRPPPLLRNSRRPRRAAAREGPPPAQGSYRTPHPPLPRGVRSAILINNQYYEMRFTI